MRRFLFLPVLMSLLAVGLSPVWAQTATAPQNKTAEADEDAAAEAAERKAIEEAFKARKQAWEAAEKAYQAMSPEERKAEDARRAKEQERSGRMPLPEDGYDWQKEDAASWLTASERTLLAQRKFAVGLQEFRQSFQPYDAPKGPVFITSDSLLNVYHVLFEDSFRELEIRRAGQLKIYLETMLKNARAIAAKLPFPKAEYQPAWRQVQLAVGPAMRLLGTPSAFFDELFRSDIEAEVDRIRGANGAFLPKWLEPATADFLAIDYGRLKPVGFYVGSRLLEDYFRAVRWLQLVPFRIERDNEFGAIALLDADLPKAKRYPYESYLKSYESFLGRPDGRLLDGEYSLFQDWAGRHPLYGKSFHSQLDEARKRIRPVHPAVQDTLRLPKPAGAPEVLEAYHLLASHALPEQVVFHQLLNRQKLITGLQFAATNGSAWAYTQLTENQKDEAMDKTIADEEEKKMRHGDDTLYGNYRKLIASLFIKADPDAPAFVSSEAWSAKSTQTALASWAQIRHTFTLQAKISVYTLGVHPMPSGFIEPNPAFLRAYVELIQTTKAKLEEFRLFEVSGMSVANKLREQADLCDEYVVLSKRISKRKLRETVVAQKVQRLFENDIYENMPEGEEVKSALWAILDEERDGKLVEALPKYSRLLRDIAVQYEQGKLEVVDKREYQSLKSRWAELEKLATRMEALLQKQLRKRDWDQGEVNFIKGYGAQMAFIMGYFGNMHSPQDDAPRWVEIADYPDRGTLFVVAIGRPRAFYVLYPWHGLEVFCTGAVFPYFEYEGKKRLTDAEWTQSLGKPDSVPLPDWVKQLYATP